MAKTDAFTNKVAIVTGGASGIGRGLSEELARQGAIVVVADINAKQAKEVAQDIENAGGRAQAMSLDVSDGTAVKIFVDTVVNEHQRIDFVFNNAGVVIGGEAQDMSPDNWSHIINVNLWGVIHGVQAAYPLMVKQGFGHIINTASLAALVPWPGTAAYAATKHGVLGFSTSLRAEAADLGVRVSVVCPGFIDTDIYQKATYINIDREKILKNLPPWIRMSIQKCARIILKGVVRNQAIIVVGWNARLIWNCYRLTPSLYIRGTRIMARALRKAKQRQ